MVKALVKQEKKVAISSCTPTGFGSEGCQAWHLPCTACSKPYKKQMLTLAVVLMSVGAAASCTPPSQHLLQAPHWECHTVWLASGLPLGMSWHQQRTPNIWGRVEVQTHGA